MNDGSELPKTVAKLDPTVLSSFTILEILWQARGRGGGGVSISSTFEGEGSLMERGVLGLIWERGLIERDLTIL